MDRRGLASAVVAAALGSACAGGSSPATTTVGLGSMSSTVGESDTGGTGSDSGTGTGGDSGSGTASSGTGVVPTCDDGAMNGDETDIDCGGSCTPCGMGHTCIDPADCDTGVCEQGLCCTATSYEKSTGPISGSAIVCCDGDDERLEIIMCGDGVNYSAEPEGANCARTTEGAMNNGSACVTITCQMLACDMP